MNHDNLDLETLVIPYDSVTMFGEYKITIEHDTDVEDPREWGNLGKMVCWHNRYNLGDYNSIKYDSPANFFHELSGLYADEYAEDLSREQLQRCTDMARHKNVILPLYLYDHSGITISTNAFSCSFDSGQVGHIFMSIEDIQNEYNEVVITPEIRKTVAERLSAEVKTYDNYLTGNVYGFIIEKDDEEVDSCWGFFGYDDECMISEIKKSIKYDIEQTPQQKEMAI